MAGNRLGNVPTIVNDDFAEIVAHLIAHGKKKSEIKRFIEYAVKNPVSPRSIESLMSLGRKKLADLAQVDRKEMFDSNVIVLRSMIANDLVSDECRLRCIDSLNEMFGLGARFNQQSSAADMAANARKCLAELDSLVEQGGETDQTQTAST